MERSNSLGPKLSIIILNYNTRTLTASLLESIGRHVSSENCEIILVDNNSSDKSVQYLQRRFPGLRIIANPRNVGFGRAVNVASRIAAGDYIWLLNSDCVLDKGFTEDAISYLEDHTEYAMLACRLIGADGEFQASCRRYPSPINIWWSRGSVLSRVFKSDSYTLSDYSEPTRVDASACTSAFIRKSDFENAGGFDERFFIYLEDTDLCVRFHEIGKDVVYHPGFNVRHGWAQSFHDAPFARIFLHHISISKYFRKRFAERKLMNALFDLILGVSVGIRSCSAVFGFRF